MKENSILQHKWFLFITEFFAGMAVMAVELGASRLLAPYFSSSQVVWTIIIGTIMVAMALGNLWGGRMADKNPAPERLYRRILIAAIWIAVIPFAGRYILLGISLLLATFVNHNFLVWASFLSCFVLFVFPLVLLGTVTPSLAKYTTDNLTDNGKIIGELNALNTTGSIIGTFLPTFVTIPAVGTAATFLIFAAVLAIIAIIYLVSAHQKKKLCIATVAVLLAMSLLTSQFSFAFWENTLIYEDESIYNYLQVKEDEDAVVLSTNVLFGVQSMKMKSGGLTGMYYDYALAAPVMAGLSQNAQNANVMILGLGSGTFATACTEHFPGVSVEGVEIDEKIASLATKYFDMPDSVKVTVADGRTTLANDVGDTKYDVIMVDAYQDITIPFQMSTVEFFSLVKRHLKETGVMVVNMNLKSKKKGAINDYLCDTISQVFPQVYLAETGGNCEVFASKTSDLRAAFSQNRQALTETALSNLMTQIDEKLTPWEGDGTLVLTDDKAPVELLGMRVLDEVVGDELDYYRDLYLGGGDTN